jgi:hypothetical protein
VARGCRRPLLHGEPAGEQPHQPGIKITDNAIIPMKERFTDQRYDPLGRVLRS